MASASPLCGLEGVCSCAVPARRWIRESGGQFHAVVDDGGHTNAMPTPLSGRAGRVGLCVLARLELLCCIPHFEQLLTSEAQGQTEGFNVFGGGRVFRVLVCSKTLTGWSPRRRRYVLVVRARFSFRGFDLKFNPLKSGFQRIRPWACLNLGSCRGVA